MDHSSHSLRWNPWREPLVWLAALVCPLLVLFAGRGREAWAQEPPGPWWQPHISQAIRESSQPLPITLESLILRSLQYAPEIRAVRDQPLIRETAITEAQADFDWIGFMETRWNDINEPVGNTLTTGGPSRFSDHRWDYSFGTRRRNRVGGAFEIAQRFGYQDNNSIFTIPNPQGTARLTLSYTQPLLRRAGRLYNTSLIVLAEIDTGVAYDQLSRQLQSYLLEVARAYWSLYLQRGSLLQRRRSYHRAATVLADLEHRRQIDAVTSQIVRARAEAAARRSDLLRAETAVRNSESRIRSLVSDPQLGTVDQFELTPLDVPASELVPVSMEESMAVAFRSRPEIGEALKQIKSTAVRLDMSKNELLPVLDVILETYVNGLRDSDIGNAWVDQFGEGTPSYSAGLLLELPFGNRAARARYCRRRLELRQLQSEFQATLESLALEVQRAVREVETSYREMHARFEAMESAAKDVDYIQKRWELLPGADQAASLLLDDLLASQDRLAEEEFSFLGAQVGYTLSIIELQRAMGTLLEYEQISMGRSHDGLPSIHFHKTSQWTNSELFPPPPASPPDGHFEEVSPPELDRP